MMRVLAEIRQKELPEAINKERGRLIDGMIDAHKHSALGVIAVFGDMDLVYGISALLLENGMKIHLAATGTAQKKFKEQLQSLADCYDQSLTIFQDTDFETIHEAIHDSEVNLMIGHSDGKFIWEKEGIDFIRVGFPVHDHVGAQRKLMMGYRGSLFFLDEIVNHLLDQKHINYRKRMYDAYYLQKEVAE
jgi:nitrogenase molybdenum-iron protein NifN